MRKPVKFVGKLQVMCSSDCGGSYGIVLHIFTPLAGDERRGRRKGVGLFA